MLNRTKTNKTAAKIQIILGLAICLLSSVSCERKDLFLRVSQTQIAVELYDINLELLWGIEWETQWQYHWDEAAAEFGMIGYTKPELIKGTIYSVNPADRRRYNPLVKIFDSNGGRLSLNSGSTYDMMFYNFGTEWTSFNESRDYDSYTATTRRSPQSSWTRTRGENELSEMPDTTRSYIDYNQPDELFGTLVEDLLISEDPTTFDKEVDENGNITYIYRIDASLRPYSFIYMYQIIVLNNKDEKGDRIKGSKGLTVTGLSQGVELFSRRTFDNTISITTEDVKPMQHHENVLLPDGTIADNADIMASRILTWGLPGINPIETTKSGTKVSELDRNYIGIGLTLRNGYTYPITLDITDQMHSKPTGGVITVYIDAADVPEEILEQKEQSTGGGFNANVQDWANEINAEVTI